MNTKKIVSINPTNGESIASVYESSIEDYEKIVLKSKDAYDEWKKVPAPVRGQLNSRNGECSSRL